MNEQGDQAQTEKSRLHFSPLWVNDHSPFHAELVMNSTDVVESAWRREGHPKAGYAGIRLGEVRPILRRRRQESRVHAVRG